MTPLTSSASTVLGVGLTSATRSLMDIRTLTDWTVRPHLLAVEGVAEVNVFGGEVRQWQIQVDPDKLIRYGLALNDVVAAASKATGMLAAGFVKTTNQHIIVNAEGQPASVESWRGVLLAQREGRVLRLGDVARVYARRRALHLRRRHRRQAGRVPHGAGPAGRQYARGHPGSGAGAGRTEAAARRPSRSRCTRACSGRPTSSRPRSTTCSATC